MKNRKLLPLSLSIAAISLLVVGFSNIGFMASASTGNAESQPQSPAPEISLDEAVTTSETIASDAVDSIVPEAESLEVAPAVAAPDCFCDKPGDCGIPGCPEAACVALGCAGKAVAPVVVPAAVPGCACRDGGCGWPACPGASCDGVNCPGGRYGCCAGSARTPVTPSGCGCRSGLSVTQAPVRSGCGCH